MRRSFLYICISLLTFAVSATIVVFLFVSRQPIPSERKAENLNLIESKTETKEQNYYQLSEKEREYRTSHTIHPRAPHSNIIGRLAEFAERFGKSQSDTFYISEVESVDDDNQQKREHVYAYWKEDNGILILYPPFELEDVTYYNWVYGMRRIDLSEDLVATEKEVGTTNYLVTKAFADELLDKCVKRGMKVTIDKSNLKK